MKLKGLLLKEDVLVRLDKVNKIAANRPFRWDEAFMIRDVAPDGDSGKPGNYSSEKGLKVWTEIVEAGAKIMKDISDLVEGRKEAGDLG